MKSEANAELLKTFLAFMDKGCILAVVAVEPSGHSEFPNMHLFANVENIDILSALLRDTLQTLVSGNEPTNGYAKA